MSIKSQGFYYSFEVEGARINAEAETLRDAQDLVDDWWSDECFSDGIEDGETRSTWAKIMKIDLDTHDVIEVSDYETSFECERSDKEEHGTYWGKP